MRREIDGSKDLRSSGSVAGKVWKCSGSCVSLTASQSGSHIGCHIGVMCHAQLSSTPFLPFYAMRRGAPAPLAQAQLGSGVVGPALDTVRILGDIGHQGAEFARRVLGEQLGR